MHMNIFIISSFHETTIERHLMPIITVIDYRYYKGTCHI